MKDHISARQAAPGSWQIAVFGEVSQSREDELADALGQATAAGATQVALDFGGVRSMDGSGLSLLLRFSTWCRDQGQRPSLWNLTPRAQRVLSDQQLGAALSLHGLERDRKDPAHRPRAAGPEICPDTDWACGLGRVPKLDPDGNPMPQNVAGAGVATPMDGFGELWHKTYRLRLGGIDTTPEAAAAHLHGHLGELWPRGSTLRLVGTERDLTPGAVGHIQLKLPGGAPLSTGVRVLHRSPTSLTFVTLSGHMEAGWITFCARNESGTTVVQVESTARTGDPMFEFGFKLFGHGEQEAFWRHTLTALANHLGVAPRVQVVRTRVDAARNWDGARNLTANAAIRTGGRALLRLFRGDKR